MKNVKSYMSDHSQFCNNSHSYSTHFYLYPSWGRIKSKKINIFSSFTESRAWLGTKMQPATLNMRCDEQLGVRYNALPQKKAAAIGSDSSPTIEKDSPKQRSQDHSNTFVFLEKYSIKCLKKKHIKKRSKLLKQ